MDGKVLRVERRRRWNRDEKARIVEESVQEQLKRDPHCGDLYIFRGRRGDLAKILRPDGLGLSLYAKRLDRGKFIWPSAKGGVVSISAGQIACSSKEWTGGIRN